MKTINCMSIAGSDSIGGTGIQADIATFTNLGCHATSCITGLTAQNSSHISAILAVNPEMVEKQVLSVFSEMQIHGIKVGILLNQEIIESVKKVLSGSQGYQNMVIDPVMISSSGILLLKKEAIHSLVDKLFPLAKLITPNLMEAEFLSGFTIKKREDFIKVAKELLKLGPTAVLVKGGHYPGEESFDCLVQAKGSSVDVQWINKPKLETLFDHGTGCTLSSAITAQLAKGDTLIHAVQHAKNYLFGLLNASLKYMQSASRGPVLHHLYQKPSL